MMGDDPMSKDIESLAAPETSSKMSNDNSALVAAAPVASLSGTMANGPLRKRTSGLGRGLSALLDDAAGDAPTAGQRVGGSGREAGVTTLAIASIHPHPDQPRRYFAEDAMAELAASIAARGVIQPILVRPAPDGHGWQLVAGERRWRAAQRAGLHQIPAIVRTLDDSETFTLALVENIQRHDLSAIEEAEAFVRLRDELGHSAEAIGQMTGKSRSHIANLVRLLDLPAAVRTMIADGRLGMGHARAIIGAPNAEALAQQIVADGLSVRAVEAMLKSNRGRAKGPTSAKAAGTRHGDPDIAALESHLSDLLGLKVRITHRNDQNGAVTLDYSNLDQLDMLCQRLSGEAI